VLAWRSALIAVGLRQMWKAAASRDRQIDLQLKESADRHAETIQRMDEQRRQDDRRHAEAMAALSALIERTGGKGTA
jgi:hypothetical protein